MAYVEEHYGPSGFNRPDIVDLYRNINLTIIKADMLRYMIMYAEVRSHSRTQSLARR